MRPVLILQHQTPERPGYLATWLNQHSIEYTVFNAGAGDRFPTSIEPYSALAVMGGGMSANDDLISNRQAEILILQAMRMDRPVIGHCLGAQLMSRALGANVQRAAQPEIGWQPIQYASTYLVREWFGLQPTDHVIQWHYDTFDIPRGATPLASSPVCANQAWCLGPHLAMQFHIEIDSAKIAAWVAEDDPQWAQAREQHPSVQSGEQIVAQQHQFLAQHQITANNVYTHWLSATRWRQNLPSLADPPIPLAY